ncbi:MAG: glycosylhydrolase-like jelly roll fold domain-containing protein, partial [Acidobacteriaceae bacterium]
GSVFLIFARPPGLHLVAMEQNGNPVFPSIRAGDGVFSAGQQQFVVPSAGTWIAIDSQGRRHTFVVPPPAPAPLGPWTLSFPAGWGAPPSVPLARFQSWTESADPGIRYFSGTAVYRSTLLLPAAAFPTHRQLWLHLGQVREIATVMVNGHEIETVWRPPFTVRIDPLLHPGSNTIDIQVTNLWPNRLIGDLQPSAARQFTHTNVRAYTMDSPLLPSGILQPVVLLSGTLLRWQ